MKNEFLNFLKKYWRLVLINLIIVIGIVLSKIFGDVYIQKNALYSFNLHSVYVFTVLPIYSLLYGCLSYTVCRKIWFQQLILAIALLLGLLISELFSAEDSAILVILILVPCFTLFSIFTSVITAFIFYVGRKLKEIWAD